MWMLGKDPLYLLENKFGWKLLNFGIAAME